MTVDARVASFSRHTSQDRRTAWSVVGRSVCELTSWLVLGSRRGCARPQVSRTVLLCLGANAEHTIAARRMPNRQKCWTIVIVAPTDEQRATLEQCGRDASLVNRCVLKQAQSASGQLVLECFFSFTRQMHGHEVGVQSSVLAACEWCAVRWDAAKFKAFAKSCKPTDFLRGSTLQKGTRTDLQRAGLQ